jgi:hypothetical protein
MEPDQAADALRALLARAFHSVRWIVEDLTDDEYFWEPTPGCWSIRRREEAADGWGTGDWVCEDGWPPPNPVPLTTIGWRVAHLAAWTDVYRDWTFGGATLGLLQLEAPGSAAAGVAWLRSAQDAFAAEVEPLTDARLRDRRAEHTGEERSVGTLVREIAFEHIHHGAEVGVLRDLHRGHARIQPLPEIDHGL